MALTALKIGCAIALLLLLLSWSPGPSDKNYSPPPAECGYYGCP